MTTTGGRPGEAVTSSFRPPSSPRETGPHSRVVVGRSGRVGGGVLSRSMWIMVDQGLASLVSLAIGFAAARGLTASQFGVFATLYVSFLLSRGFLRAVVLDPVTMRFPGPKTADQSAIAISVAIAISIVGTALAVGAAVVFESFALGPALAASLALLALLLVDCSRLLVIASGEPARAAATSASLLVGVSLVLAASWQLEVGLGPLMAATAIAATLSLLVERRQLRRPAAALATWRWVQNQRSLINQLLVDFLANLGVVYVAIYLLAFMDLSEAGLLRAAQMIAAPLYMLFTGITQVVMTEGSRESATNNRTAVTLAKRALWLSALGSLTYLFVIWLARDLLAEALGATGGNAIPAIAAMVFLASLTAVAAVATGLLRAVQRPNLIARARLLSAPPILFATILGAATGGATGIIYFGIAAQIVTLPLWAWAWIVGTRDPKPRSTPIAATPRSEDPGNPAAQEDAAVKPSVAGQTTAEWMTGRARAERPSVEPVVPARTVAERVVTEQAAMERAAQERAALKRAALERAAAEQAADESAALEQAAVERAVAERAAVERAVAERAAAQQVEVGWTAEERIAEPSVVYGSRVPIRGVLGLDAVETPQPAARPPETPQPENQAASVVGDGAEAPQAVHPAVLRQASQRSLDSLPMAHGIRVLTTTNPGSEGVSAKFIAAVFIRYSWLLALCAISGAILANQLTQPVGEQSAVASVPMALESVEWSELEASHRANEWWIATQLRVPDVSGEVTVRYRAPDSLQLTAFSLEATAPSDAEARTAVSDAAAQLIASSLAKVESRAERDRLVLNERIATATDQISLVTASLGEQRTRQLELIAEEAEPAVIAVVTGDVWSLETERNAWEQELFAAETALARLKAEQTTVGPTIDLLGDVRIEKSSVADSSPLGWVAGALVGLWVGTVIAYLLVFHRGRVRGNHPRLARLGLRITDLGDRSLDLAASLALFESIVHGGTRTTLVNTSNTAGATTLAAALVREGADDEMIQAVSGRAEERYLVGTVAVLVASKRRGNIQQVLAWHRRCEELEVPVARLVLTNGAILRELEGRLSAAVDAR